MKSKDLKKLQILITVVPNGKKEIIIDLLEQFEVNFSFSVKGNGTSPHDVIEMLGLSSNDCEIVFSFIRTERVKDAILSLEDKFKKFKYNQSMAFSIPMANIIGMQNYLFLSNLGGEYIGK